MNEITDNFIWTRQLECPPTLCNDTVKKILCKGVLELLWEDISQSAFPTIDAHKARKNILLHKLKHGINDSALTSIKDLSQLRHKSNTFKHQISVLEENYEEQDHIVRQKMQRLKEIKNKRSMITTKKELLKLKHIETNKQFKDCSDMRRVCQHLMPKTSKDIDQQMLRENLNIVGGLRAVANKKQVWEKISNSLGSIETQTLWTHLYQKLSEDLDTLIRENSRGDCDRSVVVGENINTGIAKSCGQYICMISKRVLSHAKANKYQQRLMEFIQFIESLSPKNVSEWLALTLEVKKMEIEQTCMKNEIQKLKSETQNNPLLNFEITQLTADIETVDAQMDGYIKDIQRSLAVLNSAAMLILKTKEKLHYESQKIMALQTSDYDPKWLNNSLDIELDVFYNTLDLNALRKVMLKGDIGLYRHAVCGFDNASITTINPQCSKIKSYFPMLQTPIYCLIDCYKNTIANKIYTKLYSATMENVESIDKIVPVREKCHYNSLELLNLSKVSCDQAREEIENFNTILNSWITQDVQEAMELNETTVDDTSFKDWLQRYNLLLYMIHNTK